MAKIWDPNFGSNDSTPNQVNPKYGGGALTLANPDVGPGGNMANNPTYGGGLPADLFTNPQYGAPLAANPAPAPYAPPTAGPYAPTTGGGGAGASGGGGGPAAPVQGGRQWYDQLGQQGQSDYQNQFLGGDADYNAQMGQYNQALNDFIARITNQKAGFQTDTNNAVNANTKNQGLSATQLGEDFGARGMSYSGLFDKSRNLLNDRYADQEKNIRQVGDRNMQDADNRQADFSNQNAIDQSNAKRAALGRMLQQQQLIDSGTTF